MADLPAPLTPPDANLKPFKDMPLEVARFAKSGLVTKEDAEAIVAAILLWGASWHELPAGSLPDDDKELANLAGYGRAVSAWMEVKAGALRGWIKCSDGRLYHEVVAEKVRESWLLRLKHMHRNYGSSVRMWNSRNPNDQRTAASFEDWNESGRPEGVARARQAQQTDLQFDENSQNDEMLRATDADGYAKQPPDVTRLNPTIGQDRIGQERNGLVIAAADAREIGPDDLSDGLCRIAGIRNLEPGPIAANMATVREWLKVGADPPMLEQLVKDGRDNALAPINSLKYFDGKVREVIARRDFPNGKRSRAKRTASSLDIYQQLHKERDAEAQTSNTR